MSRTAPGVDLRPDHWAIVCSILRQHVPDREVLAFGSRATWTAKDYSDLDLAIMGDEPLSPDATSALAERFGGSDLPFKVDLVDWARIDDGFRGIIRRDGVDVQFTSGTHKAIGPLRKSSPASQKPRVEHDIDEGQITRGWLYHPVFPTHWRSRSLYSVASWVNGIAFKRIQFSGTGRPVIKIAEIKGGISGQTRFTQQTFDDSVFVRPGDLLFSWSGQPETSIDAFWWRGPEGWLNQHVFKVTPEVRLDATFFYYLLRYLKPNFVGIARNKQTTGLGHVTKRDLENLEVAYPDLTEQRSIAHVLGCLDDKIELNRRMNETLEASARVLFKSWFVDFDPVRAKMEGRHTGLPQDITDLFPDRLVNSEMGKIPEWWEVASLGTVIEIHDRKRIPLNKHQRAQRQGPYPYYGAAGIMDYVNDFLFDGVYVLSGEDGSVVDAHGHPVVQYVWGKFWVNNHAHVLKGRKDISEEHLYLLLQGANITAFVTGAVQPQAQPKEPEGDSSCLADWPGL